MITMVQGTNMSDNWAAPTASVIAAWSAMYGGYKTLVLQLVDNDYPGVEGILTGQRDAENRAIEEENGYISVSDKGMDPLMLMAMSERLTKEHFDAVCDSLLSDQNMLDIAAKTVRGKIMDGVDLKNVKNMLDRAEDVYDHIVVLMNGKDTEKAPHLLECADTVVTCVKQVPPFISQEFNRYEGESESATKGTRATKETARPKKKSRSVIAVMDYEPESAFNLKKLQKTYGVDKSFGIPHNVGFRDASNSKDLFDFILKNIHDDPEDDNYYFVEAMQEFTDYICKPVEKEKEEEPELNDLPVTPEEKVTLEEMADAPAEDYGEDVLPEEEVEDNAEEKLDRNPKLGRSTTFVRIKPEKARRLEPREEMVEETEEEFEEFDDDSLFDDLPPKKKGFSLFGGGKPKKEKHHNMGRFASDYDIYEEDQREKPKKAGLKKVKIKTH